MKYIDMLSLPFVSAVQMAEVDRVMMADFGIGLIQMMENAGRNLAHLARQRFFAGDPLGKRVAVMAGPGGNGGGALVAARHLHNWGAGVHVCLGCSVDSMAGVPGQQLDILQRMGITGTTFAAAVAELDAPFDLIVDGLIGYSLKGAPRGIVAELILWANNCDSSVLSLDIPSGVDATSGKIHALAVKADATVTLALPKTGLAAPSARALVGELYLADIGVPPELYRSPGLTLDVGPLFAREEILRLW